MMDALLKRARRESGLAHYERTCPRKTHELGRLKKACFVPGTQEHGKRSMMVCRCNDLLKQYRAALTPQR